MKARALVSQIYELELFVAYVALGVQSVSILDLLDGLC